MNINTHLPRRLLTVAVSSLATMAAGHVIAEDLTQRDTLQIVAKADAGLTTVISALDLERSQANTLADIFRNDPSITAGGASAISQKVYVRNLGEGSMHISIDGATQVGSIYHHAGRLNVEPELLKTVEVQAGVGEATNGPGALGGAIRFETKDPEDLLRDGEDAGVLLKTGFYSNGEATKSSAIVFGRLNDQWSALASAVVSENELYEDGASQDIGGTAADQKHGFIKLVGQLDDAQRLVLSYEQLDADTQALKRPEWKASPSNPVWNLNATRKTANLRYNLKPLDQDLLDMQLTLFRTTTEQVRIVGAYQGEVESYGFDVRNTSQLDAHELIYGFDYRDDEVTAGVPSNPDEFGESADVAGVYIQDHYRYNDDLLLSFGTRYDRFKLNDRQDQTFEAKGLSPNAGFVYDLNATTSVHGGYAEAIRGRDIVDAFKADVGLNNPNLEAERARNAEIGLTHEVGNLYLGGALYQSRLENAIGNNPPWSKNYNNLGDIKTDGFYLQARYDWDQWEAGLAYNRADSDLNGETLTRYAVGSLGASIGDTLVADLTYTPTANIEMGWIGQFVRGIDDILVSAAGESIDKPGYNVHNLFASWYPLGNDSLKLNLTVHNLFNKDYIDHASIEDLSSVSGFESVVGVAAPGRDIRLSMAMRF